MKTIKEKIAVMEAFDNGAEIEFNVIGQITWAIPCGGLPNWNWADYDYRVKETPKFWKPKNGEEAWCISSINGVECLTFVRHNSYGDIGMSFETQELAIKARDIMLAKQRLKEVIFELNDGVEYPFVSGSYNYCVGLASSKLTTNYWVYAKTYPNWMYLKDEESCSKLIETHPEDLLLVLSE